MSLVSVSAARVGNAVLDAAMVLPNKIEDDNKYMADTAEARGGSFLDHVAVFLDAMHGHLDDELDYDSTQDATSMVPSEQDSSIVPSDSDTNSSWWNPLSW